MVVLLFCVGDENPLPRPADGATVPLLRHGSSLFQISHCDARHIQGLVASKPTLATMSIRFSATSMKVSATRFLPGDSAEEPVLWAPPP